ncbi:MAG: efflux RND transporter periplasmic adaptor subunit [Bacteroidota bacterium]|nr:efflux RND transporter periplasmic adaptor subunit [Bacteroidota bacterium]
MKLIKNSLNIFIYIFLFITFFPSLFIGCSKKEDPEKQEEQIVEVKSDVVRTGDIDIIVKAAGSVSAYKKFQLSSFVSGIVTKFNFYNGDIIKKGETICTIRTKESQGEISGAEKLYNKAENDSQKKEALELLKNSQKNSNEINIVAPFTGVLLNKVKNAGELISENEVIGLLIDPSSLIFLADVPASDISRIKIGEKVAIQFPSLQNKRVDAVVKKIEPQVNAVTQTIPVYIDFSNKFSELRNALFGEAFFKVGTHKNTTIVPSKALLYDDEKDTYSIFKISDNKIAKKIAIKLIVRTDSSAEISTEDIKAGNKIIIEGHYGLPDSIKVRITL